MAPSTRIKTTIPGLDASTSAKIIDTLQQRLTALLDLQLTLKHIHWNVVGMNFISIHEMLDPQVDAVRAMADEVAERIATLGGEPIGTPGAIVKQRKWHDYPLGREPAVRHLAELDTVYTGVITSHRKAIEFFGEVDPMTEDLLIGGTRDLELFQWFVRAHLKDAEGDVVFRNTEHNGETNGGAEPKAKARSAKR
ncbi:MAG: DNA starvation/stationary phase protection protein Dps [Ilumatobacteraceae bacterium]